MLKNCFKAMAGFSLLAAFSSSVFAAPITSKPLSMALTQVKPLTKISVLLPSKLPSAIDANIHASAGTGDETSYEIRLYYQKGVGDAGFAGYFSGKLNSNFPNLKHRVSLVHGVMGYFLPGSRGGSRSPSTIEWSMGNVTYTAQLKLPIQSAPEQQATMVAVADSAIEGGAR